MNIFILLPCTKYKEWKRERKIYCEQNKEIVVIVCISDL